MQAADVLQHYYRDLHQAERAPRDDVDRTHRARWRSSPPTATQTEIDTLVLATGFNLWDVNFPAIEVIGRDGRNLGKWWREQPLPGLRGRLGAEVPELPHPGEPVLVQRAVVLHHDRVADGAHDATVARCAAAAPTFEVTEDANARFLDRMTANLDDSVFYGGSCGTARSYYFNQHGEAALLRPTSTANAFTEARSFPLGDYRMGSPSA